MRREERFAAPLARIPSAGSIKAVLLRDAGDLAGAEREARVAVAHSARALGQDSPYRAMVMDKLASILIRAKKYGGAQRMLDGAWKIFQTSTSYGPDHPEVQTIIKDYVALFTAMGKPALAAQWRKQLVLAPTTHNTGH